MEERERLQRLEPWPRSVQRQHSLGGQALVSNGGRSSVVATACSGPQVCPESRETRMVIRGRSAKSLEPVPLFMAHAPLRGAGASVRWRRIRRCSRTWSGRSRGLPIWTGSQRNRVWATAREVAPTGTSVLSCGFQDRKFSLRSPWRHLRRGDGCGSSLFPVPARSRPGCPRPDSACRHLRAPPVRTRGISFRRFLRPVGR